MTSEEVYKRLQDQSLLLYDELQRELGLRMASQNRLYAPMAMEWLQAWKGAVDGWLQELSTAVQSKKLEKSDANDLSDLLLKMTTELWRSHLEISDKTYAEWRKRWKSNGDLDLHFPAMERETGKQGSKAKVSRR